MQLSGDWDCTTMTPMGEQQSVVTFVVDGDRFTGTNVAEIGSVDMTDGRIDGNEIRWQMRLTKPMPMTLHCSAEIDGDRLEGEIRAGGFGTYAMWGTRRG